jgi:hypothetical protein
VCPAPARRRGRDRPRRAPDRQSAHVADRRASSA